MLSWIWNAFFTPWNLIAASRSMENCKLLKIIQMKILFTTEHKTRILDLRFSVLPIGNNEVINWEKGMRKEFVRVSCVLRAKCKVHVLIVLPPKTSPYPSATAAEAEARLPAAPSAPVDRTWR